MEARLAAGDANVVYTFLCAYLFLGPSGGQHSKERHWEEAALTNGLKVVLHPLITTAAEQQVEDSSSSSSSNPPFPQFSLLGHAEQQEDSSNPIPLSLLRGSSVSVPMDVPLLPLLGVDEEDEDEDEGDLEAQLDILLDAHHTAEQEDEEGAEAVVVKQGTGKELGRLSSCLLLSQRQEEEKGGGMRRRSGLRARRAMVAYAEAEEEEESNTEAEELSSSSSAAAVNAGGGLEYDYPGRPEPAGKRLPDRGRHKCRMPGCVEEYRWPDYFCKVHGVRVLGCLWGGVGS